MILTVDQAINLKEHKETVVKYKEISMKDCGIRGKPLNTSKIRFEQNNLVKETLLLHFMRKKFTRKEVIEKVTWLQDYADVSKSEIVNSVIKDLKKKYPLPKKKIGNQFYYEFKMEEI